MGKRIISQARGHGSLSYRVRKKAFKHKIKYPQSEGSANILEIIHSAGHTAPLARIRFTNSAEEFHNPAFNGCYVGQIINVNPKQDAKEGDIIMLKNAVPGAKVFNIENNPGDGGKMMRSGGTFAILIKKNEFNKVVLQMSNKHEIIVSGDCRATLGSVAGSGRVLKPFIKAGKKFFK